MIKNYFKIAWRNLVKNKIYSIINIGGLTLGLAVAMVIGLWIYDELSYDKYHKNYDRIAQVMQSQTYDSEIGTTPGIPIPLGNELRTTYGDNFKYVILSTDVKEHVLSYGDKKLLKSGNFMEPKAPEMFSLKMLKGNLDGLKDQSSIFLSQSVAEAIFKDENPLGKTVRIDDSYDASVTGIYEDLPFNATLKNIAFIAPWDLFAAYDNNIKNSLNNWGNNAWRLYVQIEKNANMQVVSANIKNSKLIKTNPEDATFKPAIFLQPMSKWRLYSEFKNGINTGGKIQYVWIFGIVGLFVLLLACINFMNLSTARSEKRAKETGVRKAIGSLRIQLVGQFLAESILFAFLALCLAFILVQVTLPVFNALSDKQMGILWLNPLFWLFVLGFTLFTGFVAGSYPAFYLSGFNPVVVLKGGSLRMGKLASLPRKTLVVAQFAVSLILMVSVMVVFRQVKFAQNRPVGYDRSGLLTIQLQTQEIYKHFEAVRNDLLNTGAVTEAAESLSPTTEIRNEQSNFEWKGKKLNGSYKFATVGVSQFYGKTVGWQFKDGKDYTSGPAGADAMSLVINEAAQKYMGLKNPIGEPVKWMNYNFKIIGVTKDMVMTSPYEPAKPTIFYMAPWWLSVVDVKLKPEVGVNDAVHKIEAVFKKYNPVEPFNYTFADDDYAKKFFDEKKVGNLAIVFAILAIFISCLGLFGLASFVAEQRAKEIGIRKVLGASVSSLWQMLTKEFVVLVMISCFVAIPLAYYFMHQWLQKYTYRTEISWWIFAAAGIGTLIITLLTVSFQAVKAAMANPVKSLRTE